MGQGSKIAAHFDKKRIFRWQQVKNTPEDRKTEHTIALSAAEQTTENQRKNAKIRTSQ